MSSVWNKIVGQHKAVERLQQLAINNVHAFLFIGPEGCGKEDAARAFASVLITGSDNENSREAEIDLIMERFDTVVESSKVGCRKPETRFYEIACDLLDVAPNQCVFLDDLGINLKPAAAMGMQTIKVSGAAKAINELEAILGIALSE